jgi:hypothetical protein
MAALENPVVAKAAKVMLKDMHASLAFSNSPSLFVLGSSSSIKPPPTTTTMMMEIASSSSKPQQDSSPVRVEDNNAVEEIDGDEDENFNADFNEDAKEEAEAEAEDEDEANEDDDEANEDDDEAMAEAEKEPPAPLEETALETYKRTKKILRRFETLGTRCNKTKMCLFNKFVAAALKDDEHAEFETVVNASRKRSSAVVEEYADEVKRAKVVFDAALAALEASMANDDDNNNNDNNGNSSSP